MTRFPARTSPTRVRRSSARSGLTCAVANGDLAEATVGVRDLAHGDLWRSLFDAPELRIEVIDDVAGVALGGALKNIVAVAAGFSDGLGFGNNSKAAIIRIGLLEMRKFAMEFVSGTKSETFVAHSAGIADLITSCECALLSSRLLARLRRAESQMRRGVCQDGQGALGSSA